MNKLFKITVFSLGLTFLHCSYLVEDAKGQVEVKPNVEINTPTLNDLEIPNTQEVEDSNLGELPNDPQQMFSWRCNQGNNSIAVEVKDVDNWQKILDVTSWSCQKNLSAILGDKGKFSCTPQEDIGILTVFWLQGEEGKEQMQTWFDNLNENHNMVCYKTRTNRFW